MATSIARKGTTKKKSIKSNMYKTPFGPSALLCNPATCHTGYRLPVETKLSTVGAASVNLREMFSV